MSAPTSHDPLVVNTRDGVCWERRAVTDSGLGLYAVEGSCKCPPFKMATLAELAERGIVGSAYALPMPVGPEPQALLEQVSAEISRFGIYGGAVPATKALVKRADELVTENASLRARVAELEAERQATNEWVDDAAKALRANRDRIAEMERPAVERHRVGVRDSYRQLAAQARTDGDYEGEAVVLQQLVEREAVWAREDELAREFAADPLAMKPYVPGPSVGASVDKLTRLLAPSQALREPEPEFHAYLHHPYTKGHDRPETGGAPC